MNSCFLTKTATLLFFLFLSPQLVCMESVLDITGAGGDCDVYRLLAECREYNARLNELNIRLKKVTEVRDLMQVKIFLRLEESSALSNGRPSRRLVEGQKILKDIEYIKERLVELGDQVLSKWGAFKTIEDKKRAVERRCNGSSILHAAAFSGEERLVSSVLKMMKGVGDAEKDSSHWYAGMLNARDFFGNTALIIAVKGGTVRGTQLLLSESLIDANIHNYKNRCALAYALKSRNIALVDPFLLRNARENEFDLNKKIIEEFIIPLISKLSHTHSIFERLLLKGTKHGFEGLISYLMMVKRDRKLDLLFYFDDDGTNLKRRSALYIAAIRGHVEVCRLLLTHGADPNIYYYDIPPWVGGTSLLEVIVAAGNNTLVELLVDYGAKISELFYDKKKNSRNNGLWSSVQCAASTGNCDILEFLVRRGKSLLSCDTWGSLLHLMAQKRCQFTRDSDKIRKVIKFCKEKDLDMNKRDVLGDTPLHIAVLEDYVEMIEPLLALGAQANLPDGEGKCVLEYAKPEIKKILLRHSAKQ